MVFVSNIALYEKLKLVLGESQAREVVEFIDARVEERVASKQDQIATKLDIATLKMELGEVKTLIADTKSDLIR